MTEEKDDRLFLSPKVNQYGSHMIMTNVNKPTKVKYLSIDTRFCDEYNYNKTANFQFTLPNKLTDIKSISIMNIELPMSFYNISLALGNNTFSIQFTNGTTTVITIPDGNYDLTSVGNTNLKTQLNTLLTGTNITFDISGSYATFIGSNSAALHFDTGSLGLFDKFNLKSKFGWLLGFRQPYYVLSSSILGESFYQLSSPRYLYLVIDEFSNTNPNSFLTELPTHSINKNIIARISLNRTIYPFGSILLANFINGYLLSDTRNYYNKIDIQKMNIQLVDEYGRPINLNGLDFSFSMMLEYE